MNCRLCQSPTRFLDKQKVLGKVDASYFQCSRCDLIQTEKPYWLAEAYSEQISSLDMGVMQRNLSHVKMVKGLAFFLGKGRINAALDYGGGPGIFVRMMRDEGFNFFWNDRYCPNLVARGFELRQSEKSPDFITCFEVFEHFDNVQEEVKKIFEFKPRWVLVGTLLHWGYQKDWWYLSREMGQHIAFYSRRTMDFIGEEHGYQVLCGFGYTLFVRKDEKLSRTRQFLLRKLLSRYRWLERMGSLIRSKEASEKLLVEDLQYLSERIGSKAFKHSE